MRTDDLIRALAADASRPPATVAGRLSRGLPFGLAAATLLFALAFGPRPDIAAVADEPRFLFKIAVALLLAVTGGSAAVRLARPEADLPRLLLAAPALLLGLGVAGELATMPAAAWQARLIGNNAPVCLVAIPLLALPLLAAGLFALRQGAPSRPAVAGALAGLLASGLAAGLYAAHCSDDSPLFVATWYTLATGIVTGLGALLGRRLLRW